MGSCLGIPTIDIDAGAITDSVKEKGPDLKKEYDRQVREFNEELDLKGKVEIPDRKILMEKGQPSGEEKEVKKNAIKLVGQGALKDQVKESVWNQVEPKLSEQVPDQTPEMAKKKALEIAHKKVDDIVDKAMDSMIDDYYKKIDAGTE